ncbi:M24 family metallopeptidase [Halobellus sp. H-GB7]|uniref:M24 family metallopeptidase n=1 Tax=Halobellus sp. H-GB7 TaxID=3069756 RepID=UPI0027AF0C00|nr:M24 family metallopeptidase [Halobellus sp. H-GB7]MDQ2055778.1 M24 family metallopeptidase [Halobellus sp. H-GB7]
MSREGSESRSIRTDWSFLDDALGATDAVGFVAAGGRRDDSLRYLTRFDGPDREYAFVRTAGATRESVLCAPAGFETKATRQFDGRVATERAGDPAGERAAAILDHSETGAASDGEPPLVLVPPTIPHDAAVYLERAGYELQSTTAVADARRIKTDSEIDAIRGVQAAAVAAVRHAEGILAAADAAADADAGDGGGRELRWQDAPLTTDRLTREVNAELARHGVSDVGNTVVSVGAHRSAGDGGTCEAVSIRTNEPIRIEVAPRGSHGYHGALTRTVVVDSDGGWDRRAYVAVESALDAGLSEIEAGADAGDVAREADAELAAFGFDPTTGIELPDGPLDVGYGVGLSRRESPPLRGGTALEAGMVIAVAPGVADPEQGCVRLSALVVVTGSGYERLGDDSHSFSPRA